MAVFQFRYLSKFFALVFFSVQYLCGDRDWYTSKIDNVYGSFALMGKTMTHVRILLPLYDPRSIPKKRKRTKVVFFCRQISVAQLRSFLKVYFKTQLIHIGFQNIPMLLKR